MAWYVSLDNTWYKLSRPAHRNAFVCGVCVQLADEVSELQLQKRQLQVMLEDRDRSITDAVRLLLFGWRVVNSRSYLSL